MSWLGDVLGFEKFNLKEIGKGIKDNPARMLYGAADPASTKVWNAVLGRDDKPLVDQWGGAAPQTYTRAREAGIDTGPGQTMHGVAKVIAAAYAGGYGAGQLGGGAGAAPGAGSSAGLSSADAAALYGNTGYGAGMTGAETSAFDAGLGSGGTPFWKDLLSRGNFPVGGQSQPQSSAPSANEELLEKRRQLANLLASQGYTNG